MPDGQRQDHGLGHLALAGDKGLAERPRKAKP